jgi:hypothetical protein
LTVQQMKNLLQADMDTAMDLEAIATKFANGY